MSLTVEGIDTSCKAAVKFTSTYYDCMDNKRHLLMKLYGEASIALWNGNPLETSSNIFQFLSQLPASKHEISSIDAQPVRGESILVQVSGSVSYAESLKRHFSQTFVLSPVTGFQYLPSYMTSPTDWNSFLPTILGKDFEPNLAKNSTSGWRISLDDNLKLVSCKTCRKKVLESALLNHSQGCTGKIVKEKAVAAAVKVEEVIREVEIISNSPAPSASAPGEKTAVPSSVPASKKAQAIKKRKLTDPSKSKSEPAPKKAKPAAVFNPDTQCGVKTDSGICTRAITCKMHSVFMKRAVSGRRNTYDILFAEYQSKASSLKKGTISAAASIDKPEPIAHEVDIVSLLSVLQSNNPRQYVFNHNPTSSLAKLRKKTFVTDILSKA